MTPGTPKPFYPSVDYHNSFGEDGRRMKPWIMLSGDDDGKLYILVPNSEGADDFSYTKNILVDTQRSTSGENAIISANEFCIHCNKVLIGD
jgi:hypothetical protein